MRDWRCQRRDNPFRGPDESCPHQRARRHRHGRSSARSFGHSTAQQPATGTIDGVVTRLGTAEPIADVHISVTVRFRRAGIAAVATRPGCAANRGRSGAARVLRCRGTFLHRRARGHRRRARAARGLLRTGGQRHQPAGSDNGRGGHGASDDARADRADAGRHGQRPRDGSERQAAGQCSRRRRAQDYRSGVPSLDLIDGKETDDRGAYRVFRLPPGEYLVVALQGHGSGAAHDGATAAHAGVRDDVLSERHRCGLGAAGGDQRRRRSRRPRYSGAIGADAQRLWARHEHAAARIGSGRDQRHGRGSRSR